MFVQVFMKTFLLFLRRST